jgi:hypothetical protein
MLLWQGRRVGRRFGVCAVQLSRLVEHDRRPGLGHDGDDGDDCGMSVWASARTLVRRKDKETQFWTKRQTICKGKFSAKKETVTKLMKELRQ